MVAVCGVCIYRLEVKHKLSLPLCSSGLGIQLSNCDGGLSKKGGKPAGLWAGAATAAARPGNTDAVA